MKLLPAILILTASMFITGCGEPAADVAKAKRYDKDGLTFQYPGNWKIEEDEKLEGAIRHLIIETEGDAVVVVQLFPEALASPLEDYAREFSTQSSAALPVGKMVDSKFTPLPEKAGFLRVREDCVMKLLSESIPHVRRYGCRDFGAMHCYLTCQVAAEDLSRVEAGFDQIEASVQVAEPAADKAP